MSEAEYSAIVGDDNTLLRAVRKLVDLDAVDVALFDLPYFEPYFNNEEFRAMNDTIVARANTERAKLGLGPYNPMAVTN